MGEGKLHHIMKKVLIPLILAVFVLAAEAVQAQQNNASQVYSLFVLNIAKYSSWPADTESFHIAVIGDSDVYEELLKYSSRGINGKKMKLTKVESVADLGDPQLIYLPYNKSAKIDELVKATQGKAVMIVTEREGLHKKGAGFSFFINSSNNLRFDINMTELDSRRIKVARNLAGMAHEVI